MEGECQGDDEKRKAPSFQDPPISVPPDIKKKMEEGRKEGKKPLCLFAFYERHPPIFCHPALP